MNEPIEETNNELNTDMLSSVLSAIKPGESGTSELISGLLSNPEMLSKLPSIIETVKPLLQNVSTKNTNEEKPKKDDCDRRTALLLALKPYLSPHRCEAVDYIVKISGITKLLN